MKIISKYKDYFDYLVGYYGIDENVIYERKAFAVNPRVDLKGVFAIADKLYWIEETDDGFEIVEKWKDKECYFYCSELPKTTQVNELLNEPILMCQNIYKTDDIAYWYPVYLSQTPICKLIPAIEMYQLVYDWMLKQKSDKENMSEPSDKEKIINKGFDLKSSFRPKTK